MKETIDRRRLLARSALIAPAAGLASLMGAAEPANADEAKGLLDHPIVGTWHVDITFPGPNPPEKGLFLFTNTGLVMCTNTRVRDLGLGKWQAVSYSRINFTFRHHMFMPDGSWIGTLDVAHSGSVTQKNFSSSGTGTMYDTGGNQSEVVTSQAAGVRF